MTEDEDIRLNLLTGLYKRGIHALGTSVFAISPGELAGDIVDREEVAEVAIFDEAVLELLVLIPKGLSMVFILKVSRVNDPHSPLLD